MSAFLLYLLKSTLLLAVFDAFFLLVMRRDGHFRFNRFTLLAGSAVCLLLPLIPVRLQRPTFYSQWIAPAVIGGSGSPSPQIETVAEAGGGTFPWSQFLLLLYLAGALVTLCFYLRSYGSMFRLLQRTPGERSNGYTLHMLEQEAPSFSWLRHIVIARSDLERYPAILTHEQAHVHHGHSVDLLLSSLLTIVQWFNPLVWICRSELKLLHEYEADESVLNQGIDATQYQLLLVKKAVGEKRFLLANGFNHAQLKNRITMMQNTQSAAWKKCSVLLLIPLLAGTLLLLAECKSAPKDEPAVDETAAPAYTVTVVEEPEAALAEEGEEAVPFEAVEGKPTFQDGDANSFAKWVNEKLKYPDSAKEAGLQGRVVLQFTVEKDGSVTDVKVLRGVDPILDNEALRIVSQSPKWNPGTIDGKPVRVTYVFPVVYQLK